MAAMAGIASILSGKETSSLLGGNKAGKEAAQGESFLQALNGTQGGATAEASVASAESTAAPAKDELWDKFQEFVGNTLFGQTLASMRKSLEKPAYFHGGQTEEIFQQQLDQHLVKHVTEATSDTFIRPMYEHFNQQRSAIDFQA